jgi:hypothetical protein
MGYNSTASTITLTARLTPIGRQRLVSTNNTLIKTFSLGDSDANYNTDLTLISGEMPGFGGTIGVDNTTSNSTTSNIELANRLIVNPTGSIFKAVSTKSSTVITQTNALGSKTISGSNITINYVNRNDLTTDPLVNLYKTFGLSLDSTGDAVFTATTSTNGGYSNTALSGMAVSKIIVIGVDNSQYGELLDGKTVKVTLPTSAGTYTIYSSFLGGQQSTNILDANYTDAASATGNFGYNVAPMFCDTIMKPNGGDASLSWATGYGLPKPFSLNGKSTYNLQTNTNLSLTADTVVGMAYLDKGFIVITNPTIVNNALSSGTTLFSGITATTVTSDSVATSVSQMITCIADRGEFATTTNTSFGDGDTPRISEIGLYDDMGNLIAYGKPDRQINKTPNEFMAISVIINI